MLGFDYIREGQTNRFWFKLPSFLPEFNETLNTKIISITFFRQKWRITYQNIGQHQIIHSRFQKKPLTKYAEI